MEAELVPKEGFDFKTIRVKGMPRKLNKDSFVALKELFNGLRDSNKILKDFKPDIVIGTGGYVSGPIVYKAKKTRYLQLYMSKMHFLELLIRFYLAM